MDHGHMDHGGMGHGGMNHGGDQCQMNVRQTLFTNLWGPKSNKWNIKDAFHMVHKQSLHSLQLVESYWAIIAHIFLGWSGSLNGRI